MRYKLLTVILFTALQLSFTCLYSLTYTVTSTADAGAGTLREAITLANANPGADIIHFDFGVAGVKTITLLSDLPDITDQLFIDGSSDPFYAGVPLVEINANGQDNGLEITSGGDFSHIHALIVNNATFDTGSKGIEVVFTDDVRITGCYVGTDATGTAAIPNAQAGIYVYFADRVTIGGTGANEGNLVSGNGTYGIYCWFANDVEIYGNKAGTDITGTASLPNGTGAFLWFCRRGTIGGTTAAHRNLFSGNTNSGLYLHHAGVHEVYGNYAGTDISGTTALPNGVGIQIGHADTVVVGGPLAGQGNLISGNSQAGLNISHTIGSTAKGNLIGTDISGTLALPNQREGITVSYATQITLGGLTAAERNIVAANVREGISVSRSDSVAIYGNYIGTDISGNIPLANQRDGIYNYLSYRTYIGNGTAAGANVISANGINGILISSSSISTAPDSVIIKHNYIGTDATGLINLANTNYGVSIQNYARGNIVGGTNAGDKNWIANNLQGGVQVNGVPTTENQILGNSIYDHPVQGIRLSSGNNLQEAPDLTGFTAGPGTSTILGNFTSAANTNYRLEFFTSNTAAQGKTFIGSTSITTDAAGFYALNEVLPVTITAAEPVITATATDPLGNTSEFGVEIVLDASLNSFTVESLSFGKALLNWETEGEDPNTYFEIEHKSPTQDFLKVGEQKEYVSLNQSRLYQFEVDDLLMGTHYFRLVQINEGGLRSYSKSLELEISQDASHQLLISNPLNRNSSIQVLVQQTQAIQIDLFTMNGKKIGSLFSGEIEGGSYQKISLGRLGNVSSGLYIISMQGRGVRINRKVILE